MAYTDQAKRQAIQDALKRATASADQTGQDYTASLLASGGIKDALARMMNQSDPTLGQLRTEKTAADTRVGSVFANSLDDLKGITDPTLREAIRGKRSAQFGAESAGIGGRISDVRGDQSSRVDSLASLFGATTAAKQFDVSQKNAALVRASGDEKTADEQDFSARMDDLTRREKEARIAASNRSNRGDGITIEDQVNNPLLAFLAATGGKGRKQKEGGGFDFFDKTGKPITVEQAASLVPGGTAADLLSGSANKTDQQAITDAVGKPLSAAALQQKTNRQSGTQSLSSLETLLSGGISDKDMLTSKTGLTSLLASNKAKQYRDAARNVADMVARIRTGAQINEKEMELYLQFVPGPSDTPTVRAQKIATLKTIFGETGAAAPDVVTDTGAGGIPGL